MWRPLWVVLVLCAGQVGSTSSQAAGTYSADAVKAAFLYRFAGYVDWPSEALAGSLFTIAVLGPSSITEELERLLPQQSIKGRPAVVRRIRNIGALGDAQILFIAPAYEDPQRLIAQLGSRPVLVVTDVERGLEAGGVLNFVEEDRRVRFEASLDAAQRANLKISSELLAVAARVLGGRKRGAMFLDDAQTTSGGTAQS